MPPDGMGGPVGMNTLPVGARLGEFEIVSLIGEGGFGIVYLAYDHSLDRQVALKEYKIDGCVLLLTEGTFTEVSESERDGRRFDPTV